MRVWDSLRSAGVTGGSGHGRVGAGAAGAVCARGSAGGGTRREGRRRERATNRCDERCYVTKSNAKFGRNAPKSPNEIQPEAANSQPYTRGAAGPIPFHAFRRACAFYSWYRLRPTWWAPAKSKDIVARARSFRVRPFWPERRRMSCASTKCTEVLAERHKSDCRSTAGEDQQGLRLCGLEGRRSMQ